VFNEKTSEYEPNRVFATLELICIVWFSAEFILRISIYPNRIQFMKFVVTSSYNQNSFCTQRPSEHHRLSVRRTVLHRVRVCGSIGDTIEDHGQHTGVYACVARVTRAQGCQDLQTR
jgi:hypothetical protein